jgi:hypothetical protein
VYTSFAGGNGPVRLHGTNQPSVLGSDVSAGCIPSPNRVITRLASSFRSAPRSTSAARDHLRAPAPLHRPREHRPPVLVRHGISALLSVGAVFLGFPGAEVLSGRQPRPRGIPAA